MKLRKNTLYVNIITGSVVYALLYNVRLTEQLSIQLLFKCLRSGILISLESHKQAKNNIPALSQVQLPKRLTVPTEYANFLQRSGYPGPFFLDFLTTLFIPNN